MEFIFNLNNNGLLLATPLPGLGCREITGFCGLLKDGRFEDAIRLLERRLENEPGNSRLLIAAAGAYLLRGDLLASRDKLVWAGGGLERGNQRLLALEALLLLGQGRPAEAEAKFRSLSKSKAYRDIGYCGLGHLRMLEGMPQKAAVDYSAALSEERRSAGHRLNAGLALWLSGQPERGASLLQEAALRSPRFGEAYLMLGLSRLASGKALMAAAALLRAEELRVSDPRLFPALGTACRAAGLDHLAARYLEKALGQTPSDEDLRDQLVVSLMRGGNLYRAGQILSESQVLSSTDAPAHFLLGLKFLLCDQPQAASQVLFRAVALGKRDADAFFALGQALLLSDLPQPASASLRLALQLSPRRPEVRFVLAVALSQMNDVPAALEQLQEVARLNPDDTAALQLRMDLLRKSGDARQCAAVGRRLLELQPDLLEARFTVALCLAQAGELETAFEQMQDALDRDQDGHSTGRTLRRLQQLILKQAGVAGWHLLLALVHQHRGDWSDTILSLERFILLSPSQRWTQRAVVWLHRLMPEQ